MTSGSPVLWMRISLTPMPLLGPGRPGWLQFQHQALDAVGAQSHLQVVGRHDHLLDQQLDDARLLGWKELVPNGVEPRHGDGDLGFIEAGGEFDRAWQDVTQ